MPLRLRLSLVVAALAVVLVAGGGFASYVELGSGMRATLERALEREAGRAQDALSARLLVLSPSGSAPRPSPDQSLVQVISSAGALRYTTGVAGRAPLLTGPALGRARQAATWAVRRRPEWHNPHMLLAEPVKGPGHEVLVVGTSLDQVRDTLRRVRAALLVGGGLVVVVSSLGAWMLAGGALRPVERLRSEASELSLDPASTRLGVPPTHDELAALATTLNGLLDRLAGTAAQQRKFVAAASHELRTPLAGLRAELDSASAPGCAPVARDAALLRARRRAEALGRLCDGLLLLAQDDSGTLRLHQVSQALEPVVVDALCSLRARAESAGVVLVLDAEPGVRASLDELRFAEVVENLVDNALRHAPRGSAVEVVVSARASDAVLEVSDRGPGFDPAFRGQAFEAFSRADESRARDRGGAGLGLALTALIVRAHGGTVELADRSGGGATVVVKLPAGGRERPGRHGKAPGRLLAAEQLTRCETASRWPLHHGGHDHG